HVSTWRGLAGLPLLERRNASNPSCPSTRSSSRQIPGASDNRSLRSRRSGGSNPPCSVPATSEHQLAEAWRQSLQPCNASLPSWPSWLSKTYLKSDHFSGGGSALAC